MIELFNTLTADRVFLSLFATFFLLAAAGVIVIAACMMGSESDRTYHEMTPKELRAHLRKDRDRYG